MSMNNKRAVWFFYYFVDCVTKCGFLSTICLLCVYDVHYQLLNPEMRYLTHTLRKMSVNHHSWRATKSSKLSASRACAYWCLSHQSSRSNFSMIACLTNSARLSRMNLPRLMWLSTASITDCSQVTIRRVAGTPLMCSVLCRTPVSHPFSKKHNVFFYAGQMRMPDPEPDYIQPAL